MKFTTNRESLLRPLQLVTGVVERRQTLPVLSNLLVKAADGAVSITGTDLEVQLVASIEGVDVEQEGSATIPARKLADIWRSLVEGAEVSVAVENTRTIVRSGRSRFALATLPVEEFPELASHDGEVNVVMPLSDIQRLLDKTSFAMAQQDVRYFLNGMLLEITSAQNKFCDGAAGRSLFSQWHVVRNYQRACQGGCDGRASYGHVYGWTKDRRC